MLAATTGLILTALPSALAWGALGHEAVAFIAQNYVSARTEEWAQNILRDSSSTYLVNVSTWADSYRNQPGGGFTSPFHYIDAQDSVPSSCNVNFNRDCSPEGCVVSAIANYTRRVQATSLSAQQRDFALRFIVHFVGDIHQPLHNENYALGGNDVDVTFAGSNRNLHGIWDTQIPERLRGSYSRAKAQSWANILIGQINNGVYTSSVASWRSSVNAANAQSSALTWSNDANDFVCTTVAPKGWAAVESGDLATNGYYASATPTVETQIAKAGVRLAALLDAVSASGTAREGEEGDLSGADLLPPPRELRPNEIRRRSIGYGCGCAHDHE